MFKMIVARHAWPEQAGFCINRPDGHKAYTFLHFQNSVEIMENGVLVNTQPHAVVLYEPGVPQFFKSHETLIHDWIHMTGDITKMAADTNFPINQICYPKNFAFITETVAEIEREPVEAYDNYQRMELLKTEELFVKIGRALHEQRTGNYEVLEKFRMLRGRFLMDLSGNWTIKEMANIVHLSESRFQVLYKEFFGISPVADLINAKINSARNMLTFEGRRVEDVAFELGYQNVTHFIRQFKAHTNVTPAQYRREHQMKAR